MWLLWFESSPQISCCILMAILTGIKRVPLTTGKMAVVVPQQAWNGELLCSEQLSKKDIICRVTIQTHFVHGINY